MSQDILFVLKGRECSLLWALHPIYSDRGYRGRKSARVHLLCHLQVPSPLEVRQGSKAPTLSILLILFPNQERSGNTVRSHAPCNRESLIAGTLSPPLPS